MRRRCGVCSVATAGSSSAVVLRTVLTKHGAPSNRPGSRSKRNACADGGTRSSDVESAPLHPERAAVPLRTSVKILFLSQRVPYPPNRGDKITTWRLVERMKRSHDVRVVAFAHDQADEDAAQALRAKGIPTTTVRQ